MTYFLVVSIIVAVLAILYVWYVTRGTQTIADDKPLYLDNNDDAILVHWYEMNIKQSFDFDTNDNEIAAKYLKRTYNLDINPNLIVLGHDLDIKYFHITQSRLNSLEFTKSTDFIPGSDHLFNLRTMIGKPGEIAIIHNKQIRDRLRTNNSLDLSELNNIINSDLDSIATEYIHQVLQNRWNLIKSLNDTNILNSYGSYVYLRIDGNNTIGDPVTILNDVVAMMTHDGARINILCSNFKFEALIKRWGKYMIDSKQQSRDISEINIQEVIL